MEISFTPSPDVVVILNTLLDKFENRAKRNGNHASRNRALNEAEEIYHAPRSIKVSLTDIPLPSYFSQTDPNPRIVANEQLQSLEHIDAIKLNWHPGETGHIIQSVILPTEHDQSTMRYETRNTYHATLYTLLQREPLSDHRARLESLLLAEKFRFPKDDWRARALDHTLHQLRAGKSPSPFSISDSNLNLDLLAVLQALPTLTTETPYRVFSVRFFNDSKRFEDLRSALVRLVRRANPEWKSLISEDLLRELNLVANPGYVHLAGNWELTDINGQIINLDSFTPSIGFPASQIASIQRIAIHSESVLCIENLTSFHEYLRTHVTRNHALSRRVATTGSFEAAVERTQYATLCLMGNPSPSIRHLLRLIPEEIPIHLWSDMDYGGFNILSQLRKQVSLRIQPYLMDIDTFDSHAHLSRPLTQVDARNLKRLALNPYLKDIRQTIEHILKRGLKLEQEAIQI